MSRTEQKVLPAEAGMRLDRWCKHYLPGLAHGQLQQFLRKKVIRRNGGKAEAADRLETGDRIAFPEWCREARQEIQPSKKQHISNREAVKRLQELLLFENANLMVLNKPAGLAVQGGSGVKESVDGWIQASGESWKLVHRLDKDTSGVLVIAKNAPAARELTAGFRTRKVEKTYWALVKGVPELSVGQIDLKLGGSGGKLEKTVVDETNGQKARTRYEILQKLGSEMAWLALYPETGRKHQLRAHLAAIGHPIMGDGKYGGAEVHVDGLPGQLLLHARSLDLGEIYGKVPPIHAPLSGAMQKAWKDLGLEENDV